MVRVRDVVETPHKHSCYLQCRRHTHTIHVRVTATRRPAWCVMQRRAAENPPQAITRSVTLPLAHDYSTRGQAYLQGHWSGGVGTVHV